MLWLRKCDLPSLMVWDLCLVKDCNNGSNGVEDEEIHRRFFRGRANLTLLWKDALTNAAPAVLSAFLTKSRESRISAAFLQRAKSRQPFSEIFDAWMSPVTPNQVRTLEPGLSKLNSAALLQVSFHGQLVL